MKKGMRVLCAICAAAILAGSCLSARAEDESRYLVARMVIAYAVSGIRDVNALAALSAADPALGDKWTRVMDLWETPVPVSSALPDDLPADDTLCLVVLGFELNPDGSMQPELVERLKVALAASEQYPQAIIVCSGGGSAMNDDTVTEAGRMAEWLLENGVDPARVRVEDQSATTVQNAIFTFDILEADCPQVTSIAIISSNYHIATGTLLFGAEAIFRDSPVTVISNAAWRSRGGLMSAMFQAAALVELSGDMETALLIYHDVDDTPGLPPLPWEYAGGSE